MSVVVLEISRLRPHPRNSEFFDDISGGKWEELLNSIKFRVDAGQRGNIDPIIVTQNMVIVSGHQRVRAFKELGIRTIEGEIKQYGSEDEVLLDLIETNIRQRGDVGGSAKKVGKRIKELERIYGVFCGGHGSNQYVQKPNNSDPAKSQLDIAAQMGISVDTLHNYKLLADMIPELSDLVDTGIVTKTTALAMMKQLPEEDQINLISNLTSGKKYTQKQISEAIQEYKEKQSVDIQKKDEEIQKLKGDISVLKTQGDPEKDKKIKELEDKVVEQDKVIEDTKEQNRILTKSDIESSKLLSAAMGSSTNYQMVSHCTEITNQMKDFLSQMAKYDYMADSFLEIPDAMRFEYERCIKAIYTWADNILGVISNVAPVGEYVEVE